MIRISEYAGFCPGVRRADGIVKRAIAEYGKDGVICTLGKLIHNRLYCEELERRGVRSIGIEELPSVLDSSAGRPVALILRTHGVTEETGRALSGLCERYPNLRIFDSTCPSVKRIQKIAAEQTDGENTVFLLFCTPEHPEAVSIMSYARGEKHEIRSMDDLISVKLNGKTPVLCSQTTQNVKNYEKIKIFLKKLCTNAKIFDTICSVTENRQRDAAELAAASDLMIVIGGRDSSNTRKLFEVCSAICPDTRWIESADDLSTDFPDGSGKNTAITAGASTPDGTITEVAKKMETQNLDFESMVESSFKTLHTGETVTGTVFTINENEISLDLGAKFTGVLTREQITDDPNAKLSEMFKIGDQVEVFVIRVEDGKGLATVSKTRVDRDNSWTTLRDAKESGEILEGVVTAITKGGVLVSVNSNTVFVPASQTGIPKEGDLAVLKGTKQKIKIIEFDEERKRALGSIKAVQREERRAKEAEIWASLEVGKHYMGTVRNLATYGAFVDIGGVDGMVHNSELSWKKIKHPSEVVSVGQVIDVYIKELDPEKKRISLGYKTQEMDSWFQFTQKYKVGDVVPAKIVSIMPFGAFAEVYDGVDGLIHISRISSQRINSPAEVLSIGETVDVMITEIDTENRRLALSIRALHEEEEKAAAEAERAAKEAERAAEKEARDAERAAKRAEREEADRQAAEERAEMEKYIVGSID